MYGPCFFGCGARASINPTIHSISCNSPPINVASPVRSLVGRTRRASFSAANSTARSGWRPRSANSAMAWARRRPARPRAPGRRRRGRLRPGRGRPPVPGPHHRARRRGPYGPYRSRPGPLPSRRLGSWSFSFHHGRCAAAEWGPRVHALCNFRGKVLCFPLAGSTSGKFTGAR